MNDIQTLKNNNLTTIDDEIKAIIADDTEIKAAILQNPDYVKRLLQESIIDEIKADIAQKALRLEAGSNRLFETL